MKFLQVRLLLEDFPSCFRFLRDDLGLASRLGSLVVREPVSRPDWGGRVAYIRDPEGNLFELFQSIPMEEV